MIRQGPQVTPPRRRLAPDVNFQAARVAALSPGDVQHMVPTSRIKNHKRTKIVSFNLQGGLINPVGLQTLTLDMVKLECDLALFQETKLREDFETEDLQPPNMPYSKIYRGRFIGLAGRNQSVAKRYGMAFYVGHKWKSHYIDHQYVNDRLAYIRFNMSVGGHRPSILSIINVYAPHSNRPEEEKENFYATLQRLHNDLKTRSALVVIGGDFNAKVGQRDALDDPFILGSYGKGKRNESGKRLTEFLTSNEFLASNTVFQHSLSKRVTWSGIINNKRIYNQIDYLLLPQRKRHLLINSCSINQSRYNYTSDHRPVLMTLNLRGLYKQITQKKVSKPNFQELNTSPSLQAKYETAVQKSLRAEPIIQNFIHRKIIAPGHSLHSLNCKANEILHKVAKETLPKKINSFSTKVNFLQDAEVLRLVKELKSLRTTLEDNRRHVPMTPELHRRIKARKRKVHKELQQLTRQLRKQKIEELIEEMEAQRGNRKIYQISKAINVNTSFKPLRITMPGGGESTQPTEIFPLVRTYYNNAFNTFLTDPNRAIQPVTPFDGPPRPLLSPISTIETAGAIGCLRNNKATGPNQIKAEQLKHAGHAYAQFLTTLFNSIFERNASVPAINEANQATLNKPGKPFDVTQTRPITLLNMERKVLELILLHRLQPVLEPYLDPEQSAYRSERSTTDILWTYRWLGAIAQKYRAQFHILGLDLSKAFDSIDRNLLVTKITDLNIFGEDELRMLRILLSNTSTRIHSTTHDSAFFPTTVGVPQGGGASPVFFILYFQLAMQNFYSTQPELTAALNAAGTFSMEPTYADDKDKIIEAPDNSLLVQLNDRLPAGLKPWNLKVNGEKSEFITIDKASFRTNSIKKLGSKIGETADIDHKVTQASLAFKATQRFFRNARHIPLNTRIRMYNVYVLPILSYNIGATGLSPAQLQKLDVVHRKHLRQVAHIFYEDGERRMSNQRLYDLTGQRPISVIAIERRWQFFGHALRRPDNEPSFRAMHEYYARRELYRLDVDRTSGIQLVLGRNVNNLPTTLNNDLHFVGRSLQTLQDFREITDLAQVRADWITLRKEIVEAQARFLAEPKNQRKRPARAALPKNKKKKRIDPPPPAEQQPQEEEMEIEE